MTRQVKPEAELIRFVAGPDGAIVPDLRANLPGRGVWISLDRNIVAQAARRGVFGRALQAPVQTAPELADQVARLLRSAALGRLGIARKAGAALAGFGKVEAAIGGDAVEAVLTAAGAAPDGRRKIAQALRRRFGAAAPPLVDEFSEQELSLALGRSNVIHAAVLQSPAGKSFMEAASRLQRYEGVGAASAVKPSDDPQDVMDE